MEKIILLILLILSVSGSADGKSLIDSAWQYYNQRSEKKNKLTADSANVNKAMEYFRRAMESDELSILEASTGLLQCIYFKGRFVYVNKKEKQKCFEAGISIGAKRVEEFPGSGRLKYWVALITGENAKTKSKFAAAREGVATKFNDLMKAALKNEPDYLDGMVYMYIARINDVAPKIPLVIPWPSKELSEKYFKKALEMNPDKIITRLFWADYLESTNRKEEAIVVLQKLIKEKPRQESIIEDEYELYEARRLLAKIKK